MADLTSDYQFEVDGFVFGLGRPVFVEEDGFDPGTAEWRVQDGVIAQGDGRQFGRDFREAPTWAWNLGVDRDSESNALATLGEMAQVWANEKRRRIPGAVATLRYRIAGRVRRVYGRPGRFGSAFDNRISQGYNAVTADFRLADHLHYSDVENSVTFALGSTSSAGGLKSPLVDPLRTTQRLASQRSGSVGVTTDAPTWAVVTIKGPISQPTVELVGGWKVSLDMVLTSSDSVTIDPRPWARTAILNGSASVGGRLGRLSRLADMLLPRGEHQFTLSGAATSVGATATVSWRDAHYGL